MTDYVDKGAVLKVIDEFVKNNRDYGFFNIDIFDIKMMKKMINKIPVADVAPIIRCRDCKHFNHREHMCENSNVHDDLEGGAQYSIYFDSEDYCSYGERKE